MVPLIRLPPPRKKGRRGGGIAHRVIEAAKSQILWLARQEQIIVNYESRTH